MIGARAIILSLAFLLAGASSAQPAPQFDPLSEAHAARRFAARRSAARPALREKLLPTGAVARLGSPRMRPGGHILCLAVSPDGRLLAAGGQDGRIDLWDFPARRLVRSLPGHAEAIGRLVFSPDGETLASRSRSGAIRLWDTNSGHQRREIQAPPPNAPAALCLAYSLDGKLLAANHRAPDGKTSGILLWDPASGRRVQNLKEISGKNGGIIALAFSADGGCLRAVTNSGRSYRWRFEGGQFLAEQAAPLFTVADSSARVLSAAFSSDGAFAAAGPVRAERMFVSTPGDRPGIRIQGPNTVDRPRTLPERVKAIQRLAFSPDGRYLLAEESGVVFKVYETISGQEVLRRKLPADWQAESFTFTADSRYLVSGMADATLLVWEMFAPTGIRGGRPARLWGDFKDDFAAWAHQAMSGMIAAGDEAVAFLEHNLSAIDEPKAEQVARWIAELDNDEFRVRERATKQLAKAGEAARAALERAHAGKPSLEVRRRIESLLARFPNEFVADGETLRRRRAIAVLEHIGTPAARRLLRRLSEGADTSLTREAKKALTRLSE